MHSEQLSLFDTGNTVDRGNEVVTERETVPYKVLDIVKIRNCANRENPEDYYYLKLFENKEGKILEIFKKPKLHYRVIFQDNEGFFYHKEMELIQKLR